MDGSSSRDLPPAIGLIGAAAALIAAGHPRFAFVTAAAPAESYQDLCALLGAQHLAPARLIETAGSDDTLDRVFFTVFRGTRYPTAVLCADAPSAIAAQES